LRRGQASLAEFNDEAVAETLRDKIRPEVHFIDDDSTDIEAVRMVIRTRQGKIHVVEIDAAQGGSRNPMSDADLEQKLVELAEYGGFERDVGSLAEALWSLDGAPDAATVMGLATPSR
jgi:2-methylcitrate dehydratase PrpD